MAGGLASGLRRRDRERALLPRRRTFSTNLRPADAEEGTFASPATALASEGFAGPGGPTRSTPLGILPPSFLEFSRLLKNSTTSWSSSWPHRFQATSAKVDPRLVSLQKLGFAPLLKDMTPIPRPHLFHGEPPDQEHDADGEDPGKNTAQELALIAPGIIDLMFIHALSPGRDHPPNGT